MAGGPATAGILRDDCRHRLRPAGSLTTPTWLRHHVIAKGQENPSAWPEGATCMAGSPRGPCRCPVPCRPARAAPGPPRRVAPHLVPGACGGGVVLVVTGVNVARNGE